MCGIAGFYGNRPLRPEHAEECLRLMDRRGPNGSGSIVHAMAHDRVVHLLHTRLAIIDLDPRANQPFGSGDTTLAFNGELYDHVEHRRRLEAQGTDFRTRSDTEVLWKLLSRADPGIDPFADALDVCEGMWALAWLDRRDDSLTLARDRFGEKPLYMLQRPEGLYFASEEKFLAAMSGGRLLPNLDQVRRYLVNGYKSLYKTDETFFEDVRELTPGSLLRLDGDGTQVRRYWRPSFEQDDALTFNDAVAGTRQRLIRSVELRLRADVPLAFCMSGGVDSNALLCTARRELGMQVHGFTIMNTDARYEEQGLVNQVVNELGIDHTPVALETSGFLDNLTEIVRYHDAPVYNLSYYVHWLLLHQIACRGFRVSVSGTGADELFSGYYDHHLWYLREVSTDRAKWSHARANWIELVKPYVRNPYLQNPDVFLNDAGIRDHIFLRADEFAMWLHGTTPEAFSEENYTADTLRNRMLNELFHEAVPVILHEDDRNAMYHSVENRSPFLDRHLMEFAQTIPTEHLIRNGYTKAVLREAVRGIVPDSVLDTHRKVGFNAPIRDLLNTDDASTRSRILADGPIYDLVERNAIERLLERRDLPNSESKFLFYFVSAQAFLEEFAA